MKRLLLSVSVPITEDEDEALTQLLLSKDDLITVTVDKGVTFDLVLHDVERAEISA